MLLLGLLLAGCSAAFAGLLISENFDGGPTYTVTMFGHDLGTVSTLGAFLAGLALALVFCLALAMVSAGARRSVRRSRDLRTLRKTQAGLQEPAGRDTVPAGTAPAETAPADTAPAGTAPADRPRRGFHLLGHH